MQRDCPGGKFKVWMNNDMKVKERGKAACLHSCPLRKSGKGERWAQTQQWDGTE